MAAIQNSNQYTKFFIHANQFKNVICEMAANLSRGYKFNITLSGEFMDHLWIPLT